MFLNQTEKNTFLKIMKLKLFHFFIIVQRKGRHTSTFQICTIIAVKEMLSFQNKS